jgi:outer membrane protein assembly factor BamB
MPNLQKFFRFKTLLIILFFLTFFLPLFPQLILSQNTNIALTNNFLQILDLSIPFKICWENKNEESINSIIASDNNKAFVVSVGGIIKSINSETGTKYWETNLGGEILTTPYIDDGNIFVVSKVMESQSGIFANNKLSIDEDKGNSIIIRSLSITSGITIWQTNLKTNLNPEQLFLYVHKSILIIADKAILGTFEKQLIILNLGEGKIHKIVELHIIPTAISFDITDETLFIGDQKGVAFSLKIEKIEEIKYEVFKKEKNRKKTKNNNWEFRLGAEVSNISLTPKGLLITSLDNFAYLISKKKGNLIWKKRLAGRITDRTLILNNYALITTIAEPTISIVELNTGSVINRIILEDESFATATPIKTQNKIIVPTSKGLFAFSSNKCDKIES